MQSTNFVRGLAGIIASGVALTACSPPRPAQTTLELVRQWVTGTYNNVAQSERDIAADLPPEQMHRPMHQLFAPVKVPGIDGYIVYQQSSLDGSENPAMIFRHGLLQFIPSADGKVLLQRELHFKDEKQEERIGSISDLF